MQDYTINSRIWITSPDGEMFLGQGRVELLKQIDKYGSISKAAKAMKMSYKKAWEQVNSMNQQGPELLVTPKIGGTGGGGSVLSDAGKRAIELYSKLVEENSNYLADKKNKLSFK